MTQTILVRWQNLFDQQIVKDCCVAQLRQLEQGAKILIVDVSEAQGVLRPATHT